MAQFAWAVAHNGPRLLKAQTSTSGRRILFLRNRSKVRLSAENITFEAITGMKAPPQLQYISSPMIDLAMNQLKVPTGVVLQPIPHEWKD